MTDLELELALVFWCVLSLVVGLVIGPILRRNRHRYPKL